METVITKQLYELALAKIDELLPQVNDKTPLDDPKCVELCHYSDIVEFYEKEYFPIPVPSFNEAIEQRLKEEKMTKKSLAEKIGISPSRISDFLSKKAEPSLSQAAAICKVLKIAPSIAMQF